MWPKPPIPTTPTFWPAFAWRASGAKVVMHAHRRGPAKCRGMPSGMGKAKVSGTVTEVA